MWRLIILVPLMILASCSRDHPPAESESADAVQQEYDRGVISEDEGRARLAKATTIRLPTSVDEFHAWMDPDTDDSSWLFFVAARIPPDGRKPFSDTLKQTLEAAKGQPYHVCTMNPEFGTHPTGLHPTGLRVDESRFPPSGVAITFRMNYRPINHDYFGDGIYYPESGTFYFELDHD